MTQDLKGEFVEHFHGHLFMHAVPKFSRHGHFSVQVQQSARLDRRDRHNLRELLEDEYLWIHWLYTKVARVVLVDGNPAGRKPIVG